MDELGPARGVAAQVGYHLRTAVGMGADGRSVEALSEVALALTLLHLHDADDGPASDLPDVAPLSPVRRDELVRLTTALALQLQAHFTSEGQVALADLYERAAGAVGDALP